MLTVPPPLLRSRSYEAVKSRLAIGQAGAAAQFHAARLERILNTFSMPP